MLGLDFQSWKNNNGVHLLQTGANLSRNYNIKDVLTAVATNGTVNTDYFNPKWNTKFLDFLVSKGKAQVVSTSSITIESGETGKFTRKSGVLRLDKGDMYAAFIADSVQSSTKRKKLPCRLEF